MKFCETCGELKPYVHTEKRLSKASGFVGATCWDCHIVAQRTKMQGRLNIKGPASSITYGALVLKAQSVVDKLATMEASPANEFKVAHAKYLLQKAQHKADRFGPEAFDFVAPKKTRSEHD